MAHRQFEFETTVVRDGSLRPRRQCHDWRSSASIDYYTLVVRSIINIDGATGVRKVTHVAITSVVITRNNIIDVKKKTVNSYLKKLYVRHYCS